MDRDPRKTSKQAKKRTKFMRKETCGYGYGEAGSLATNNRRSLI